MYNTMKITLGKGNLNTRCLHQKHQEALIELQIYLQDMKNVFFFFLMNMDNVYVLLKAIRAHEGYVSIVLTLGYNGISLSKHS